VLHHARGYATGFLTPAIAVPPAPTFGLGRRCRVLPAACAAGDKAAHGFSGYAGNNLFGSLRSTARRRAGVNRKRLNITAHYPNQASRCAELRLVAWRWRALRVRVMVCYVLRPGPDNGHFGSLRSGCLFGRCAQGGLDAPPALRSACGGSHCVARSRLGRHAPVCPGGAPCKAKVTKSRLWRDGSRRASSLAALLAWC
jgi:hypothetical protein